MQRPGVRVSVAVRRVHSAPGAAVCPIGLPQPRRPAVLVAAATRLSVSAGLSEGSAGSAVTLTVVWSAGVCCEGWLVGCMSLLVLFSGSR